MHVQLYAQVTAFCQDNNPAFLEYTVQYFQEPMAKLVDPVELAHSPLVLAFLGLFTHLVLHREEFDNNINTFLWIWLLGFGGIATAEYVQDPRTDTIGTVIKATTTAAAIYFSTLSVSILAHRVIFHRLRKVV